MEAQSKLRPQIIRGLNPANCSITFTVRNFFLFTVTGRFTDWSGHLTLDDHNVRDHRVNVMIRAASIQTGLKRRDMHLRSSAFLDTENHPEILFHSTSIQKGRDVDSLLCTGVLEIRGIRRSVVLEIDELDRSRSPQGVDAIHFVARGKLRREDFGIRTLRALIGSVVQFRLEVQL